MIAEKLFKLHQDVFWRVLKYSAKKYQVDKSTFNSPGYDAFLNTVKAHGDKPSGEFRHLLATRLKGACIDYLRSHHFIVGRSAHASGVKVVGACILDLPGVEPVDQAPRPGDAIEQLQEEALLKTLLPLLLDRYREVVEMKLRGMTSLAISEVFKVSEARISQILARSVEKLRHFVKEHRARNVIG